MTLEEKKRTALFCIVCLLISTAFAYLSGYISYIFGVNWYEWRNPIQSEEWKQTHYHLYFSERNELKFVLYAVLMSCILCGLLYLCTGRLGITRKVLLLIVPVSVAMIVGIVHYGFARVPESMRADFASSNPHNSWEAPFKSLSSYNEILLHGEARESVPIQIDVDEWGNFK